MTRTRKRVLATVAAASAGLLVGVTLSASAATPNDTACRVGLNLANGVNSAELLAYQACRFDKLDAAVAGLKPAITPVPSVTPAPSATASPSSTPTVAPSPTPIPTPTPSATPSSAWAPVASETFNTAATSAQVLTTYAGTIEAYQDNSQYKRANLSASDGALDIALQADGTGGAVVFGPPATRWGTTYGRFTYRMKVVGGNDHGAAGMLWPSSDVWSDGEVDYPEGNFGDQPHLYQHPTPCDLTDGDAVPHCGSFVGANTNVSWHDWHDYTIEWTAGKLRYLVDGTLIREVVPTTQVGLTDTSGSANVGVPSTKHRFMIQVATSAGAEPGHLLIDSYSIEK